MDVNSLYHKNACDPRGQQSTQTWTRTEYRTQKKKLQDQGIQVVLVDMIGHPVEDAIPISNELFFTQTYPEGTYFVLYCHSGGSSGYVQMQLSPVLPQYTIVNMA